MLNNECSLTFEELDAFFSDPTHGWSMGSFGAIAEFTWDQGEEIQPFNDGRIGRITARGAVALSLHAELKPVAYETLRKHPERWGQAVAFCLPDNLAKRQCKNVLSEIGPDTSALQASHQQHILFDMGLDQAFVDVCIRTNDQQLISRLRQACGTSLLAQGNDIMQHIIAAGPTRVFISNIGRAEVYQPIGIEKSPEGPHTHVLPKLLASKRAFSANAPIPAGYLPMLTLHAANPCVDKLGKDRAFDPSLFEQFQTLLQQWGDTGYLMQKDASWEALVAQVKANEFNNGSNRQLRTATRIAIRQYQHCHADLSVAQLACIDTWRAAFDKPTEQVEATS